MGGEDGGSGPVRGRVPMPDAARLSYTPRAPRGPDLSAEKMAGSPAQKLGDLAEGEEYLVTRLSNGVEVYQPVGRNERATEFFRSASGGANPQFRHLRGIRTSSGEIEGYVRNVPDQIGKANALTAHPSRGLSNLVKGVGAPKP